MKATTIDANIHTVPPSDDIHNLLSFLLISTSVLYLLYLTFYYCAPYIHSLNIKVSPDAITYYMRDLPENKGIETYVLYLLLLFHIVLTLLVVKLLVVIHSLYRSFQHYQYFLYIILAAFSYKYFISIGFYPPCESLAERSSSFIVLASAILITLLLLFVHKRSKRLSNCLIIVILSPLVFTPIDGRLGVDYNYIFAPALKILSGFNLSDICFQYDLLLSSIAAICITFKILPYFYILGQLSFLFFIVASFVFAKHWFTSKTLPVYLLVSLVIVRLYAIFVDPLFCFQTTPLRLDLWLILLILVYAWGAGSWVIGCAIGFLVLTHSTFGVIYLLSYFLLIFTILIIRAKDIQIIHKLNLSLLKEFLYTFFRPYFLSCLLILLFIIIRLLLFKHLMNETGQMYVRIGIGMIPISSQSFYWYFPIAFSLSFFLIINHRFVLTEKYVSSSLFLIYLSIGNSIYFFGRSHEHNIINISGSLIFVVFLLLDVLNQTYIKKYSRMVINMLAIIVILMPTYFYSARIATKILSQYNNARKLEFSYSFPKPCIDDIDAIKKLTHNNNNIYFLDSNDFWYYYLGHYAPPGRYQPCLTWFFKKDLIRFIQTLLDERYYLVIHDYENFNEILSELAFDKIYKEGNYIFVWKSHL